MRAQPDRKAPPETTRHITWSGRALAITKQRVTAKARFDVGIGGEKPEHDPSIAAGNVWLTIDGDAQHSGTSIVVPLCFN